MEAGRELDALIAEKVMGLANHDCPHGTAGRCAECGKWEVVEKLRTDGLLPISLELIGPLGWEATIGQGGGNAPTAPHAICLAALPVVGV